MNLQKKFLSWQNKLQQRAQQKGENSLENATTQLEHRGFIWEEQFIVILLERHFTLKMKSRQDVTDGPHLIFNKWWTFMSHEIWK